jgi:hypothetical protein
VVAGLVLALAQLPAADAQIPTTAHGCSKRPVANRGNFQARLFAPGHRPSHWRRIYDRDQRKRTWAALWPIRVTASHAGRPIGGGHVSYQFLFNGRIVACRTVLAPYKPRFSHGVFRDRIEWPERAIGIPLTFRVVVTTRFGVRNLNYAVTVQPRTR